MTDAICLGNTISHLYYHPAGEALPPTAQKRTESQRGYAICPDEEVRVRMGSWAHYNIAAMPLDKDHLHPYRQGSHTHFAGGRGRHFSFFSKRCPILTGPKPIQSIKNALDTICSMLHCKMGRADSRQFNLAYPAKPLLAFTRPVPWDRGSQQQLPSTLMW